MIHPSYVELMRVVNEETALVGEEPVVNSRYSIVCATAKRARQLIDGDEPYIDAKKAEGMKPLSIAVEELYTGELKILTDDEVEEKNEELAGYLKKKKQQDAIFAQRAREEEKLRREAEATAKNDAEAKALAAIADSDDEDDVNVDLDDEEDASVEEE